MVGGGWKGRYGEWKEITKVCRITDGIAAKWGSRQTV